MKFTDAGQVTLTLAVTPDGDRDRVRISVADSGVGIAKPALAGLFQRFSQVDSSVSRTHGGSGLGLAICKGLIEAMGGTVGVESVPGAGSTFWLELRLERAGEPGQAIDAAHGEEALQAHVLLVDDHPMNRELGVLMLQILGCTADVLPEQVARMREAGMVDSVEKPVKIENLQACLSRWTKPSPSGVALA